MSDKETAEQPGGVRRRRLAVAALAAAALALVGGVAAGVAAAVSHSTPTPTPGVASGPSLYVPFVGPAPGAGSGGSGAAGSGAAVLGAPAVAAPQASYAGSGAAMPSIAYPYPYGWCNGTAAAAATGPGIIASGLAQVTLPASPQNTETLNVGVQSNNATDIASALADARQRLTAIRDALVKAGVPEADVSQPSLSVYASGSPRPTNAGVNGNLTATVGDPAVLDRALNAAVAAGASNVNVWTGGAGAAPTPDAATLQSAIAKATAAAKSTAQSEAQAAGVSLGTLQSSQAQPPAICGWGPGGAQMVVAVTLTYAIK